MKKEALAFCILVILLFIQSLSAQTWTASKRLTFNPGGSYNPVVAVDSNNHIHMTWFDLSPRNYEMFYKKSTDGGTTWITKRLTYNLGGSQAPDLAIDSNNHIHMVWADYTPGNYDIYYKRSTDGGITWTTKHLSWTSGWSSSPAIAVDGNNHIHAVWYDETPGNYEIFYKKSTDGGTMWTTKRLTWTSGGSFNADIAVDTNNHIHVVWYDDTPGNKEIFYKRSTDGGTAWTTKRLTTTSGDSRIPSIAADSSNYIHVAWHDNTPGNLEIFYKRSTDGGTIWSNNKRLTSNAEESSSAVIAVDSNNHLHVAWGDNRPGNFEIYYKKGIQ